MTVGGIIAVVAAVNWHVFGGYNTVRNQGDLGAEVCPGRTHFLQHYDYNIHGCLDANGPEDGLGLGRN